VERVGNALKHHLDANHLNLFFLGGQTAQKTLSLSLSLSLSLPLKSETWGNKLTFKKIFPPAICDPDTNIVCIRITNRADKVLRRVFAQTELSCCVHRRAYCRARLGTQSFTHRIRQRDQAPKELVKLSSLLLITIKRFDRYVALVFHTHSGARCVRGLDS